MVIFIFLKILVGVEFRLGYLYSMDFRVKGFFEFGWESSGVMVKSGVLGLELFVSKFLFYRDFVSRVVE